MWVWVVVITALLTFCIWLGVSFYGFVYKKGYKKGAEDVLEEWRQHIDSMDDI